LSSTRDRILMTRCWKWVRMLLPGQPQLAEKLATPQLVQLRLRVSIVARLKSFSEDETALYIEVRLRTAGYCQGGPLFTRFSAELLSECSQGSGQLIAERRRLASCRRPGWFVRWLRQRPLGARKNYAAGRLYVRGSGGADTIVHLHPALWQLYVRAS
jgi:hypothetical protein